MNTCPGTSSCNLTTGRCECPSGYLLNANGCTDINECATNNGGCAADATCTNTPGSRMCRCRNGYTGNGFTCSDINECNNNNGGCSANATCTNTPGSRTCACNSGYTGTGFVCNDVDECATNNGGCSANAACTNTVGSRTCMCTAGFTGDGESCTDIDECAVSNGGCDAQATCTNTPGSRTCACNSGFDGNGVTCNDINECAVSNGGCDTQATCTNTVGSRTCACNSGYSGSGLTCVDVNECLTNNGGCASNAVCTNTPGAFTCACPSGTYGTGYFCAPVGALTYLKASNPGWSNHFGEALAISGDGNTIAIGAPDENSNTRGINGPQPNSGNDASGAVYVFRKTGGVWAQEAFIKPSNTRTNAHFGTSLSLSTTGDVLVVGSPGENSSSTGINGVQTSASFTNAGAAYVFTRTNTTWVQEAYVKASNTRRSALFGTQVSLSSDGTTFAVSAPGEPSAATGINGDQSSTSADSSGAVYVFRKSTTWAQEAYVKASNTQSLDQFGQYLSLSGDGNTLAVGAPGEDSNATGVNGTQTNNAASYSGAAYVFTRAGTVWSQQAYLKASNTEASDAFGTVTLSADGNTLAVGAAFEDSNGTGIGGSQTNNAAVDSGAVYLFTRQATTWAQTTYVKPAVTGAGDHFGYALSLSADGQTLAIGAVDEASSALGINGDASDNSAPSAGAVYIMRQGPSSWSQEAFIKASNTEAGDDYGHAVALTADGNLVLAGASLECASSTGVNGNQLNNDEPESGAAYLWRRVGSVWGQ